MRTVRRRFWLETGLTATSGVMLVLTALWPDWVERLVGTAPDGGDGSLEWMIVGTLALATVLLGLLARVEWVRAGRLAPSRP